MAVKRATILVSGDVQQTGYRDRAIEIGKRLNLSGYAENLPDGRVRIVAEGEEESLNKFLSDVDIKNALINVERIDHSISDATGEFSDFHKLVGKGETDERLDTAATLLKELINVTRDGFAKTISAIESVRRDTSAMLEKQDRMLEKQDRMLEKQDRMLEKQDITIEILKSVKEDTSQIREDTSQISGIRENTEKMLEKQDITIEILKGVTDETIHTREDTPTIRAKREKKTR
ncbi:Acylphosphatase [Candidatus Methanoperedenaceae archaeon GB50]|nr:Acylphosphatase [Candidatus Methanoperedenaceae archaeon GB37]CAD7769169.1 Acylphosphatase [Candidatus Methanoperedenaceae archaeon GB50]CAD7776961.1 MAG: Acylphosphatase [Candidatus Methanoperedenaceae archaeon GB50]